MITKLLQISVAEIMIYQIFSIRQMIVSNNVVLTPQNHSGNLELDKLGKESRG